MARRKSDETGWKVANFDHRVEESTLKVQLLTNTFADMLWGAKIAGCQAEIVVTMRALLFRLNASLKLTNPSNNMLRSEAASDKAATCQNDRTIRDFAESVYSEYSLLMCN